jgi:hypothetical protein
MIPSSARRGRRNLRRIWGFLRSVGAEKSDGEIAVTVPAKVVALVRSGLLGELGDAAGEINEAVGRAGYDEAAEWYAEPLKRQGATCALLDVVGWEKVETQRVVTVYLDVHREALLRAARNELDGQIGRAEDPDIPDEERATAGANRTLLEKLIAAIGGEG